MNGWLDFSNVNIGGLRATATSILAAWAMSQSIAGVYTWMHRGRSLSRNFVTAVVVSGVVGSMLMLSIGNNLARGIGIVGALALIRFRTNLSSPLDILFIFASFAGGIAASTGNIATGAMGTAVFLAVVAGLSKLEGPRPPRQAVVRVRFGANRETEDKVRAALGAAAADAELLRRRDGAEGKDSRLRFHVDLVAGDDGRALSAALHAIPGVSEVSIDLAEVETAGGDDD